MIKSPAPINVFADTLERVRSAALVVIPPGTDVSRVQVEPPRDASHGDIATNAAMVLAKGLGKNPLDLANAIRDELKKHDVIAEAVVAKPGFINLTLVPAAWTQELRRAERAGECRICLGQSDRPNACRPLPRRRVWRCAGEPS